MTSTQISLTWVEPLPERKSQFGFKSTLHTLGCHPYLSNLNWKQFRYSGVETATMWQPHSRLIMTSTHTHTRCDSTPGLRMPVIKMRITSPYLMKQRGTLMRMLKLMMPLMMQSMSMLLMSRVMRMMLMLMMVKPLWRMLLLLLLIHGHPFLLSSSFTMVTE